MSVAPYDAACAYAMQPTIRLTNIIPTMGLGDYTTIPATIDLFRGEVPGATAKQVQPRQQEQSQRGGATNRPPAQQQRTDNRSDRGTGNRDHGLARYVGTGRMPLPTVWVTKAGSASKTRVCSAFLYQNQECTRENCNFLHVTRLTDIIPAERPAFLAWVAGTPGVDLVQGGAAGAPATTRG